jgi:hypothetical protein
MQPDWISVRANEVFYGHFLDQIATPYSLLLSVHKDDLEAGIAARLPSLLCSRVSFRFCFAMRFEQRSNYVRFPRRPVRWLSRAPSDPIRSRLVPIHATFLS